MQAAVQTQLYKAVSAVVLMAARVNNLDHQFILPASKQYSHNQNQSPSPPFLLSTHHAAHTCFGLSFIATGWSSQRLQSNVLQ